MASINAMLFDISNSYLKDSLLNVQFPFWGQVLVNAHHKNGQNTIYVSQ